MKKSHLQKQNMISQINTEISISTKLKHDNIIKVYDCFEDD
jgi:serine/threonine protein kinase